MIYDHLLLRSFSYDPGRVFTSADLGIAKQPHFPVAYLDQLVEPFRPYRAGGSR
jgi:hypothetical protein